MRNIKRTKLFALLSIISSILIVLYLEFDYRNSIWKSRELNKNVNCVFEYTFEVDKSIQGIKTNIGYFNLKYNEKNKIDLSLINQNIFKGDTIGICILYSTLDLAYPLLLSVNKSEKNVWSSEIKTLKNKPKVKAIFTLMLIGLTIFFISKYQEKKYITKKGQVFRFNQKPYDKLNYPDFIGDFSFSVCNNEFIVFHHLDRINYSEIFTYNRVNRKIKIKKLFKPKILMSDTIEYLFFDFDLNGGKSSYYVSSLYFLTKNKKLEHIQTFTNDSDILFSNHDKSVFFKNMVSISFLICQELGISMKNSSGIQITNPNTA